MTVTTPLTQAERLAEAKPSARAIARRLERFCRSLAPELPMVHFLPAVQRQIATGVGPGERSTHRLETAGELRKVGR